MTKAEFNFYKRWDDAFVETQNYPTGEMVKISFFGDHDIVNEMVSAMKRGIEQRNNAVRVERQARGERVEK